MTALQHHPRRSVRLDTLVRLRWLAIFGQIAALLVVTDGLDFQLPFWRCLAVVGAYAAFNLFLRLRFRGNERLARCCLRLRADWKIRLHSCFSGRC
jgi:two-component system sensor histidine kinase RegB